MPEYMLVQSAIGCKECAFYEGSQQCDGMPEAKICHDALEGGLGNVYIAMVEATPENVARAAAWKLGVRNGK